MTATTKPLDQHDTADAYDLAYSDACDWLAAGCAIPFPPNPYSGDRPDLHHDPRAVAYRAGWNASFYGQAELAFYRVW